MAINGTDVQGNSILWGASSLQVDSILWGSSIVNSDSILWGASILWGSNSSSPDASAGSLGDQ